MNNKSISHLIIVFIATLFLVSCGSKVKEVAIKPSTTAVSGDLEGYISVVDGEYKIEQTKHDLVLTIKMRVDKKLEEKEFEKISADILDEHGAPITGIGTFYTAKGIWSQADANKKIDEALAKGSGELYIQLTEEITGAKDEETLKLAAEKAKTFSIHTIFAKPKSESGRMSVEEFNKIGSSSSVSTGSTDWDNLLDDYDKYVTEYVKFYKKAMKGDQSALAEYPELMAKATEFAESLDKAKGNNNLSNAQLARFAKIQTRMLSAMQ